MNLKGLEPWQFESAFNDLPSVVQEDLAKGILNALANKGYDAHRVDKFEELHAMADELVSSLEEAAELLGILLDPVSDEEYLDKKQEANVCVEEWKKSFELYRKNLEDYDKEHDHYVG